MISGFSFWYVSWEGVGLFGPQIALTYRPDAISQGSKKSRFPGPNPLPLAQGMDAARPHQKHYAQGCINHRWFYVQEPTGYLKGISTPLTPLAPFHSLLVMSNQRFLKIFCFRFPTDVPQKNRIFSFLKQIRYRTKTFSFSSKFFWII